MTLAHWIVMKCLEKNRTRRYETANGLAADLNRHLTNEPVQARPPSTGYRLQKAYQRNRAAFAVAAKPLTHFSPPDNARLETTVALYRTLNLHRQGRTDEAREAFRAAEARMTPPPEGQTLPVGSPARDLLTLWLAHREARVLFQ